MNPSTDRSEPPDARTQLIRQGLLWLDDAERKALDLIAVAHWIPAGAVLLQLRGDLLAPLPELLERSFVEVTDGGALTVHPTVRNVILATLRREEIAQISCRLAPIFETDGGPEARIESLYHRLAFEPREAGKQLFRMAAGLRAEPYFAHQLVRRLIQVWREFEERWGLDPPAGSYLRFTEILAKPRPPKDELATLTELEHPKGDGVFDAYVDLRSGLALTAVNRVEDAERALWMARMQFDMLGMPAEAARCLRGLGRLFTKIDQFQKAANAYGEALEISRSLELPVASAQSLQGLAEIDAYRGRLERGIERFEEAIAIQSANNGRTAEANTRISYSQLLTMRGEFDSARQHLQLAANGYQAVGQRLGQANSLRGLAHVSLEEGRLDEAAADLESARTIFEELGTPTGLASCAEMQGHILMLRGDVASAATAFETALATFDRARDRYGISACLRDLGAVAWLSSDRRTAAGLLEKSAKIFRSLGARLEAALSGGLANAAKGEVPASEFREELESARVKVPRPFRAMWDSAGRTVHAR